MAVKEQRPAVKRMKKGSSFFGYTDTSWNAGAKMTTIRRREFDKVITSADKQEKNGTVQYIYGLLHLQGSSSLSAVSVHPG